MLTYPVHQAADILFCKANLVPVGQDQLPHLETHPGHRAPVQRTVRPAVFPCAGRAAVGGAAAARHRRHEDEQEPRQHHPALGHAPTRPPGSSAARRPTPSGTSATTPPPGRRSPAWSCWPPCAWAAIRARSWPRSAGAAAAALKELVTTAVNEMLAPVRARRAEYARDLGYVRQVLRDGNERAGAIAAATLDEVRAAMGMTYYVDRVPVSWQGGYVIVGAGGERGSRPGVAAAGRAWARGDLVGAGRLPRSRPGIAAAGGGGPLPPGPGAAAAVGQADEVLRPRWVMWSGQAAARLAARGVRLATCWDITAAHRLLFGGWRADPGWRGPGCTGWPPTRAGRRAADLFGMGRGRRRAIRWRRTGTCGRTGPAAAGRTAPSGLARWAGLALRGGGAPARGAGRAGRTGRWRCPRPAPSPPPSCCAPSCRRTGCRWTGRWRSEVLASIIGPQAAQRGRGGALRAARDAEVLRHAPAERHRRPAQPGPGPHPARPDRRGRAGHPGLAAARAAGRPSAGRRAAASGGRPNGSRRPTATPGWTSTSAPTAGCAARGPGRTGPAGPDDRLGGPAQHAGRDAPGGGGRPRGTCSSGPTWARSSRGCWPR